MMHAVRWQFALLGAVGCALSSVGCQTSSCDRAADAITVANSDGVRGDNTWFSAPFHDPNGVLVGTPYAHFYPARTITFEHDLGSVPSFQISLAFSDHGSLAPGAGNEDLLECEDDHVIQLKNDTCSDFFIWVQAQGTGVHEQKPCSVDADGGVAGAPSDSASAPTEAGAAGAAP
jgi:hypothetical protein